MEKHGFEQIHFSDRIEPVIGGSYPGYLPDELEAMFADEHGYTGVFNQDTSAGANGYITESDGVTIQAEYHFINGKLAFKKYIGRSYYKGVFMDHDSEVVVYFIYDANGQLVERREIHKTADPSAPSPHKTKGNWRTFLREDGTVGQEPI